MRPRYSFKKPLTKSVDYDTLNLNQFGQRGVDDVTDHFQSLEQGKRERILNAGYQIFGRHGYRKAATADIAKAAGISKAMLFYYFTSKKEMYLDLMQESSDLLVDAIYMNPESISTDFFERLLEVSRIKIEALKKRPFLIQFLYSAFGETDPEVYDELKVYFSAGDVMRNEMMILNTDTEKFKEGIQPELVMELIMNCALGAFSVQPTADYGAELIDQRMDRFQIYLTLLKNNFYKEEYL